MVFCDLVRTTSELRRPENNELPQFAPTGFSVLAKRSVSEPCAASRDFIFRFATQRRANRRCAALSRSVQRLEGARLSAMLELTTLDL